MSKMMLTKLFGLVMVGVMILSSLQFAAAQTGTGTGGNPVKVDDSAISSSINQKPVDKSQFDPNKRVRVIVQLSDPASASYAGGVANYKPTSPKVTGGKALNVADLEVVNYESYLRAKQTDFSNSLLTAVPDARTERAFQTVLNGVVVSLPAGKIASLRTLPGVVKVSLEQERKLDMDASLPLVGLGTGTVGGTWTDSGLWETLGGHANAGKGIKIADIDSGITPTNPCFDPSGFSMPSGYPKGETAITNGKIIAARSYFRADDPPYYPATALDDPGSADGGHGTHTAGTMVCNYGVTSTFSGIKISGVAPAAQLLVYRVFYYSMSGSHSAYTPELLAAIEDAVRDGAQVVNNSWGGTNINTVDDLETIAYEAAVDAGVVIVFSAGNSGSAAFTMGSPGGTSEKFITVAASTTARSFTTTLENTARSDSGTLFTPAIVGSSVTQTAITAPVIDLEVAGYTDAIACEGPFSAGDFTGKIVVVRRGTCALVDKVANVKAGGAIGTVIRNVAGGSTTLPLILPVLPTIHIAQAGGDALKTFLTGLPAGVTATFRINAPALVNPTADAPDTIASFSSVGPNPDLSLKPDIAAPGVNTLSSVSANDFGSTTTSFDFYQGTSMAAPHVTGAAALLKQIHPEWSPAQIRSALMSTAAEPASLGTDPTKRGSGRLDLTHPDKVELTFDHPSLSYQLALVGVKKSITVTAMNLTSAAVTYNFTVTANAAAAIEIQVDAVPATSLTVPANGSKAFTVDLTGAAAGSAYGKVTLTKAVAALAAEALAPVLHLPYYARIAANTPANEVYLVDGDTSPAPGCTDYSTVYKNALTTAGITYTEITLDPVTGSGFDFFQARRHTWVLYFDGDPACSGWLGNYPTSLRNYLAQGGKMLIMGQDIGWWDDYLLNNFAVTFTPSLFFGGSYLQDNLLNGAVLQTAGDPDYSPFVGGMVIPLDPANTISVDELKPGLYTDVDALPVFANKNAPAAIGGSYKGGMGTRMSSEPTIERVKGSEAWTKLPYRTVFTSFGLENILEGTGTSYRKNLVLKLREWFTDAATVAFDKPAFSTPKPDVAATLTGYGESSNGRILYYRVDFGDGSMVKEVSPNASGALFVNHKYATRGTYKAYVEVVDEYGHKAVNTAIVHVGFDYFLPAIGN